MNDTVGDVTVTAALPVTYSPQMDGEDYVYDDEGNLAYDEDPVSQEDAPSVVAWQFDGQEHTLRGEVSAQYASGCLGPQMNSVKATVVFTNTHATDDMVLAFDYSYTTILGTGGKLEGLVSGGNASETGAVSIVLAPGESKSISLYSGSAIEGVEEVEEGEDAPEYGNVVLNLSNITVTNASETYTATLGTASYGTYQADFLNADGDPVSYVVTNQAITPELQAAYPGAIVVAANQAIEYRIGSGVTLTNLAANAGFRFDHWVGGGADLGSGSPATVIPADNVLVTAAYLQESYISAFTVGNQTYYSWDAAVTDAVSSHNPIILNQNYTFPATAADAAEAGETLGTYVTMNGDGLTYILPPDVRFVVPKSANDFGNFTNTLPAGVTATTPITHFRTLTVPGGVTLQVNGEISVNGDYYCKQPYETVAGGAHGLVSLNQNAKISVSNGGSIWCYGFIAGAGEVEIASGGHASEFLQICDWGGGSAALGWATNTANLFNAFYFSQYYVQNIEAKLRVYEGATTEVAVAIVASGQVATSHAPFIGEGGLFHITEAGGYIERVYDAATDRTSYSVYGDMETSGITVGIMQYKLSSDSFVLGINGNLDLNIESGTTTMLNDFMLLPGTSVTVAEGAEVDIAQSAPMAVTNPETGETEIVQRPVRMFIIDDYEWNNTIDTTADPLTQLQQLNNGQANYSYPRKQNTLPYTIANGTDNDEIRGNVTAESATIEVNGTLEAYSNIFTTNYVGYLYDTMAEMLNDPDTRAAMVDQYGADTVAWAEGVVTAAYDASKDKLITGSGTIINNPPVEGVDGTLNLLTQHGTTKDQVEIPTAGCLVDLNSDGTYSSLGTGTYESAGVDPVTGETLWYKNQVTYHFVVIDPATQTPTGVLPDITRKSGVDYDVLTAEDLTVGSQRYAIFGFDASTVTQLNTQTGKMAMGGVPIGYVPEGGELVKDGSYNLEGDSLNRNFATPASWQTMMGDPMTLMTYLMSTGITSGWDTMGFIFADLTQMSGSMADMLSGGLSGEITVYVVAYDNYVAFENTTTGERAQSYLPTGLTAAQYTMDGEAVITPVITDPATGAAVSGYEPTQSVDETEHTTTVTLTGVAEDLLVSMTAQYTKVKLTWQFVDVNNESVVYATVEEAAHPITDAAVSPDFTNPAHPYYLLAENANVKLSNEEEPRFMTGGLPVSITGITEPVTITVLVEPYDYLIEFTTDTAGASVQDVYLKSGDDLTLTVSNIQGEGRYRYSAAAVTGTAAAEVAEQGAELRITGVGSDCTVAVTLESYDYLVQYTQNGSPVQYDFVSAGETSTYTYASNTYDSDYTAILNNGSQPAGVIYTPPTEEQPAAVSVANVSADKTVSLNPAVFDRALTIYDENGALKKLYYGNGSDVGDNYRYSDNEYVKSLVNPNGAVVEDHLDDEYAYIRTNGTGFFPVTVQIGTYYHVVEFRYFQPDGSITGTQLTDADNVALITRIFVEEEDGTESITAADFLAAYAAGGNAVSMYQTAGDKVFLYLASYSETGDGHTNTYDSSADAKTLTVSNIGKNAFVNVIVVPYAYTLTITDSGLGTTSLYYVDASGNNLTNSYKAVGTAPVTYAAGSYRAVFGAEITNAAIDATAEQLAAGVDSVTVTGYTGDAALTVTTQSTKHKITIQYVEPWGSTTETLYPEGDEYTASFTDRVINSAVITNEVAHNGGSSTISYTDSGFTLTMPDEPTVTTIVVGFRFTTERLKYDVSDPTNSNITNATGTTAANKAATVTVVDSYYGVFTVQCAKACAVAIDNGDGTWTWLIGTPVDGEENTYEFSCPVNFDPDIAITVIVKGDINQDGQVNASDKGLLNRALMDQSNSRYYNMNQREKLASDFNKDGIINATDKGLLNRALMDQSNNRYLPFAWDA